MIPTKQDLSSFQIIGRKYKAKIRRSKHPLISDFMWITELCIDHPLKRQGKDILPGCASFLTWRRISDTESKK
jgi:hypothetical protein